MSKFKKLYRIESSRASWWNYADGGTYFITICTKNKEHFFGKIKNNKMELSHCGVLANVFWHEIKNHTKNVELGAFVVMPNHIHGILKLKPTDIIRNGNGLIEGTNRLNVETGWLNVETGHALSLQRRNNGPFEKQPILSNEKTEVPSIQNTHYRLRNIGKNSVSSIIGSYKSAVTKHANRMGIANGWQTRFHDHIIRNNEEYQSINNYIESNVMNWKDDKFFETP